MDYAIIALFLCIVSFVVGAIYGWWVRGRVQP